MSVIHDLRCDGCGLPRSGAEPHAHGDDPLDLTVYCTTPGCKERDVRYVWRAGFAEGGTKDAHACEVSSA